jgi:hypothetical protein
VPAAGVAIKPREAESMQRRAAPLRRASLSRLSLMAGVRHDPRPATREFPTARGYR